MMTILSRILGSLAVVVVCMAVVRPFPKSRISPALRVEAVVQEYRDRFATEDTNSARAKRQDLGHVESYFKRAGIAVISDLTPEHVNGFVSDRHEAGESPATIVRRYATFRHLVRRASERLHFEDPTRDYNPPRHPQGAPSNISDDSRHRLRTVTLPKRDRLLVELMLCAGLGRGEVSELRLGQIAREGKFLFLKGVRRKGYGFRNIPVMPPLETAIARYLPERAETLASCGEDPTDPLFPLVVSVYGAQTGEPRSYRLSGEAIYKTVRAIGHTAPEELRPHKLRHAFAHEFLALCENDIRTLSQLLGHRNIQTTMRYLQLSDEKLAEKMANAYGRKA